jgi:predicted 3-demethylubiquinone-9 3-methyltransferase (glyoxalase superfamily)
MAPALRIAPCLWFDSQAEEAANFYVGIFRNSTGSQRAMQALLKIKKIDIEELERAIAGA